ncbi:MAG: hypothetical protein LUE17_09265 [Planctomycetaceae bacterium]|nr:hypothetical protein [Planctomycetaceae bacterium]
MKLAFALFLTLTAICLAVAIAAEPAVVASPQTQAMMADRTDDGVVSWTSDRRLWFAVAALGALLIAAFYWARGREERGEKYVKKVDPCVYGGEEHNITPL